MFLFLGRIPKRELKVVNWWVIILKEHTAECRLHGFCNSALRKFRQPLIGEQTPDTSLGVDNVKSVLSHTKNWRIAQLHMRRALKGKSVKCWEHGKYRSDTETRDSRTIIAKKDKRPAGWGGWGTFGRVRDYRSKSAAILVKSGMFEIQRGELNIVFDHVFST